MQMVEVADGRLYRMHCLIGIREVNGNLVAVVEACAQPSLQF